MRHFMYFNQFSGKRKEASPPQNKARTHSGKAPSAMLPIFVCGGEGLDKFYL